MTKERDEVSSCRECSRINNCLMIWYLICGFVFQDSVALKLRNKPNLPQRVGIGMTWPIWVVSASGDYLVEREARK